MFSLLLSLLRCPNPTTHVCPNPTTPKLLNLNVDFQENIPDWTFSLNANNISLL